jgi:hypothetical protein
VALLVCGGRGGRPAGCCWAALRWARASRRPHAAVTSTRGTQYSMFLLVQQLAANQVLVAALLAGERSTNRATVVSPPHSR